METISTGLKAGQKGPAEEEKEKKTIQKIQERRGRQPGPSHKRKGRCYKNINQRQHCLLGEKGKGNEGR